MKYLYLIVLLLFAAIETFAQTSTGDSGLSVLKSKWQKNPATSISSVLDVNPFGPNAETSQTIQDRKDNLRENEIRQERGLSPQLPSVRIKAIEPERRKSNSNSYTYRIKVKNDGTKTIQGVIWEYIFFDPLTNQEVGRRQFTSRTNLKSGATGSLVVITSSAPVRIVNVADAQKKPREQYAEQVKVKIVQYGDGSIWQTDSN